MNLAKMLHERANELARRRLEMIEAEAAHWLQFLPADAMRREPLSDGTVRFWFVGPDGEVRLSEVSLASTETEISLHATRFAELCPACGRIVALDFNGPGSHAAGCPNAAEPRRIELVLSSHADLDATSAAFVMEAEAITAPCPRCHRGMVRQTAGRTAVCADCAASEDEFDRQARDLLSDRHGERRRSWAEVERDVAEALRTRSAERAALADQVMAMKLRAIAAHEVIWRTLAGRPTDALKSLGDEGDVHRAVHAILEVETTSVSAPEEWRAHIDRQDRRIEALEAERDELQAEAERWREVARKFRDKRVDPE